MSAPGPRLQHPVREAAWGALRVGGRHFDVGGSPRRQGDELDVEDEHPLWPVRLFVVRQRFGHPETPLLPDHHELDAFGPAGDDAVQRKRGEPPFRHRAVEHLAVGRPARVIHGDNLVRPGMIFSRARLQDFRRQSGRRFLCVVRRSGHVGRRRNDRGCLRRGGRSDEQRKENGAHGGPLNAGMHKCRNAGIHLADCTGSRAFVHSCITDASEPAGPARVSPPRVSAPLRRASPRRSAVDTPRGRAPRR